MRPKPSGLGPEYAVQFQDRSVADVYRFRPPYADDAFDMLVTITPPSCLRALDLGCGTGDIARPLVQHGMRVDAVDYSEAMIAIGRTLPGGDHPDLNWIRSAVEDVDLSGAEYGLITAGESLHWMDWGRVLPRLGELLHPSGFLAIAGRGAVTPWWDDILPIIERYSTNKEYEPYNLLDELRERRLFHLSGTLRTVPAPFLQSVDDYIESFHSRNGLSRDRMTPEAAAAFDHEMRVVIEPWSDGGILTLQTTTSLFWGHPPSG